MDAIVTYRVATSKDAPDLAKLCDIATDGYLSKAWAKLAGPDETWVDVGADLARDEHRPMHFSWTAVAEIDGKVVGMLNAYPLRLLDFDALRASGDPTVLSYVELQSQIPEGYYLANMAVYEQYRGFGIARKLLDLVIGTAFNMGFTQVIATVHSTKKELLAHYNRRGMKIIDKRPVRLSDDQPQDSVLYLLTLDKPDKPSEGT